MPTASDIIEIEVDAEGVIVADADCGGCVDVVADAGSSSVVVVEGGPPGKDAYETWKQRPGNENGTFEDWLDAIRGPQGETGPTGAGATAITRTAADDLNAFKLVLADAAGGVLYADAATMAHAGRALGVTRTAALRGDTVSIEVQGPVLNAGWSWTPGAMLYVGLGGDITTEQVGVFSQCIGWATSPTEIFLRLGRAILRS